MRNLPKESGSATYRIDRAISEDGFGLGRPSFSAKRTKKNIDFKNTTKTINAIYVIYFTSLLPIVNNIKPIFMKMENCVKSVIKNLKPQKMLKLIKRINTMDNK